MSLKRMAFFICLVRGVCVPKHSNARPANIKRQPVQRLVRHDFVRRATGCQVHPSADALDMVCLRRAMTFRDVP